MKKTLFGNIFIPPKQKKNKRSFKLKGRPNDLLGKKISIEAVEYASIAEASGQTNIARKRKTIGKKIQDPEITNFFEIQSCKVNNLGIVERPS